MISQIWYGTLGLVKLLRYVELKSGHSDNGPAWIGYVTPSKSGRTLYFNGAGFDEVEGAAARGIRRQLC